MYTQCSPSPKGYAQETIYPLCDPSPEDYAQVTMWSKFPQDGKLACRMTFKPMDFHIPYLKHKWEDSETCHVENVCSAAGKDGVIKQ